MSRVIIIGGGFGGLTAATELAKSGFDVTLLEAHTYLGGCAGTFFHQGFKFDSGATLAGGFKPGAPMALIGDRYSIKWDVKPISRAMVIHLSDDSSITRWSDNAKWAEERAAHFGKTSDRFWDWQERTADVLWDLALRLPAWPPQSPIDLSNLLSNGIRWFRDNRSRLEMSEYLTLLSDSFSPVAYHLNGAGKRLKQFVDAQLLIASQATSTETNSLYGAVALDLPRQGVVEVPGGLGYLAEKFKEKILEFGGKVYLRKEVTRISPLTDSEYLVKTKQNEEYKADILIFNQTPWNIKSIAGDLHLRKVGSIAPLSDDAWGAYMVYVGIKDEDVPEHLANHHQVVVDEPLGEGNSLFISLSPEWDRSRAPEGYRALTISTHTNLREWWRIHEQGDGKYEGRKQYYLKKILNNTEKIIPAIHSSSNLILPGTPVTFQRFTRRIQGWVGGFPQTGLLRVWGPRLGRDIWMVGDSIFPGQSVPAVSMGGIRVAQSIVMKMKIKRKYSFRNKPLSSIDV